MHLFHIYVLWTCKVTLRVRKMLKKNGINNTNKQTNNSSCRAVWLKYVVLSARRREVLKCMTVSLYPHFCFMLALIFYDHAHFKQQKKFYCQMTCIVLQGFF